MPATKLRREQLNISLNDLLWLDRQKIGGSIRTFTAESNEAIRFEVSGKSIFDITVLGNYEFNFQDNVIFRKYGSSNELWLSYNLGNFIFSAGGNNGIVLRGLNIFLVQDDFVTGLSVRRTENNVYVKVDDKLGIGLIPTYTLDVNGNVRAFGDFLSSKSSAVNIGTLTNQPVQIITNNTKRVTINNDGKIIIEPIVGTNILLKGSNSEIQLREGLGSYFGRFQRNGDFQGGDSYYTYIGNGAQHINGSDEYTYYVDNQYHNPVVLTLNSHGWKFISGPAGSTGNRVLSEVARLTWDGKLGIGMTTPFYKLDVNGDIRCFGDLLSSKVSAVNIGTLTNQAVRIITDNTARVIIPTTGYIDFKLPVKMNEGIVVDWEKRENLQILNQDINGYWIEYNSTDHGVNGWGSFNPTNLVGKVFRFMDTGQVIVLLNGQVLTEGSVINGNIVDGDYVFVNAVNSPIENGKALVLAEQPQTGDVVRVIGFFSVYEY